MFTVRRFSFVAILFALVALISSFGFKHQTGPIDRATLKSMLSQLGYDVKDLDTTAGKEKYSVEVEQEGLNIPIAFEISANGNYVWLTVYLGDAPADTSAESLALLKSNADIQPSQFYVTKSGKLMMGLGLENHELTNSILRTKISSLLDNVTSTKSVWQK